MQFFRSNGLTLALVAAFVMSIGGMLLTGWHLENAILAQHQQQPIHLLNYLVSSSFLSAVFENWESEFLQMSFYVVLTAFLYQRGSSESKDPDKVEEVDQNPDSDSTKADVPLPVRLGGLWSLIYSYSLGIVLVVLFLMSFVLHWLNSADAANQEAVMHGEAVRSAWSYLGSADLWFESFQNWQSEFLSTALIVVLSIFLRFRGSPESKPVSAAHSQTGK